MFLRSNKPSALKFTMCIQIPREFKVHPDVLVEKEWDLC